MYTYNIYKVYKTEISNYLAVNLPKSHNYLEKL